MVMLLGPGIVGWRHAMLKVIEFHTVKHRMRIRDLAVVLPEPMPRTDRGPALCSRFELKLRSFP